MPERLKSGTWVEIFRGLGQLSEPLKAEDVETVLWIEERVTSKDQFIKLIGLFKLKNGSYACVRCLFVGTFPSVSLVRVSSEEGANNLLNQVEREKRERGIFIDSEPSAAAR